jgi:hypothetical protein
MSQPTSVVLPSLASPDDIVDRLGRNLNQMEALRVDAMLRDGSAIIRRYARERFTYAADDVLIIAADAGVIVLPDRPVYSVKSVIALSGAVGIPNVPITWYVFDGIDKITIPDANWAGVINLPEYWYDIGWFSNSYQVTHTHGFVDVPAEISGLLCSAIISELATPTQSATIQSEAIGAYSYSMRRRDVGGGIFAALNDFGMKQILADYRKTAGTIVTRF